MSTRLVYQQCVDECASIQKIVSEILRIKDEPISITLKHKRFDDLQSGARKHLSTLRSFVSNLNRSLEVSTNPENRKKLETVEAQYTSILESYRKAVYVTSHGLELLERTALLSGASGRSTAGGDTDFQKQMEASLQLTADMRLHARRLAEEVARGNANAELVDDSSNQLESNLRELKEMGGQLSVAGRLGVRLSRRRVIDSVIFILVFGFFYLTCAHIILKRLYLYRLFGL